MLVIIFLLIVFTSPWFLLVAFQKLITPIFYIPTIGDFFKNFFSYFSFDFLFFNGDPNQKNSIPSVGNFYLWELPFFLIGLYVLLKNNNLKNRLLGYLIILFTSLASLFKISPSLPVFIPALVIFSFVISKGIEFFTKVFFRKYNVIKFILITLGIIFIIYNLLFFIHQYRVHYPKRLEKLYG